MPSAFQTPMQTSSQRTASSATSGGPRSATRPAVARAGDEQPDEEQEADHAGLGERLHVEVLHAPGVLRARGRRAAASSGTSRARPRGTASRRTRSSELSNPAPATGWSRKIAPADVDQQRPLDERLDVALLLLRPDPEVAEQVADVAAAERDEPGDDDEREARRSRRAGAARRATATARTRTRRSRRARSRSRPRSTRRGSARCTPETLPRPAAKRPPARPGSASQASATRQRAPDSAAKSWWPRNDGCRQPRRPAGQDPPAEELDDRDRARAHAPGDEHRERAARGRRAAGRARRRPARAARTRRTSRR